MGPDPIPPPTLQPPPVVLVVEPFFENAPVEQRSRAETVTAWSGGAPREATIVRTVAEKPLYARVPALELQHRIVIDEIRKMRPEWRVVSTGELPQLSGPVQIARVVVGHDEMVGSNRTFKSLATAVGVVIWPLLLVNMTPVHEVQRVHGVLTVYDAEATQLRGKLIRYPTQPDFAVDTRGLPAKLQPFALDVEYEEGLFASDEKRAPVLLRGFAERLAVAIVARVEGIQ